VFVTKRILWKGACEITKTRPGLCTKSRFGAALHSAKGEQCNSLGQRPRLKASKVIGAESAELICYEV
jgi:hypothetical protein